MSEFYATFMQKQAFCNHFVKIHADTIEHAREAMFAHFGDKFGFVYTGAAFHGQTEKFGLSQLCTFDVTDHGSGSLEFILV